jgi:hypothetical protein
MIRRLALIAACAALPLHAQLVLWQHPLPHPQGVPTFAASLAATPDDSAVFVAGHAYLPGTQDSSSLALAKLGATDGAATWSRTHPGPLPRGPHSMALDARGDVFVTGHSIAVGEYVHLVTAKYSGVNGGPLWTYRHPVTPAGGGFGEAVALDSAGNPFVAGTSYDPQAGMHMSALFHHDAMNGTVRWARIGTYRQATAIGVDRRDDVYVAHFDGSPTSGTSLVKYDGASGIVLWERRGLPGSQQASLSVTASGDVYIASTGPDGVMVTRIWSSDGLIAWQRTFGGADAGPNPQLAVDGGGQLVVASSIRGSDGRSRIDVRKLDPWTGTSLWEQVHGETGVDAQVSAVTFDQHGHVVVTGAAGWAAILTLKFSASDGSFVWRHTHAGTSNTAGVAVVTRGETAYVLGTSRPSAQGNQEGMLAIAFDNDSPAPFEIGSKSFVPPSTWIVSDALVPGGFTREVAVAVSGGEWSAGCSGTFTTAPGVLAPGQAVCVRHVSGALPNQRTRTTLNLAGVIGRFQTFTAPGSGSVAASPSSLGFGRVWLHHTSPSQPVVLSNTGAEPVTVHEVLAFGEYSATHDCGLLAPGASCTAHVAFTPRVSGTLPDTLQFLTTAGVTIVSIIGTGERSLAPHYYASILGRSADPEGAAFWDGESLRIFIYAQSSSNEPWYVLAGMFFASPEYAARQRSAADFLGDLYRTFFNRPADAGGVAYWSGEIAAGLPREVVLKSFMFSPEFAAFTRGMFGDNKARMEVEVIMDFYRGLLARLPDNAGLAYWLGRFRIAQCSGATAVNAEVEAISSEFLASAEYAARQRDSSQRVSDLYNAFLRRGGDVAGFRFWRDGLAAGTITPDAARRSFMTSPEFQQRVARVVAEGCQG